MISRSSGDRGDRGNFKPGPPAPIRFEVMSLKDDWQLVVRGRGGAFLAIWGSQVDIEARARVAEEWGDTVEVLGPSGRSTPAMKGLATLADARSRVADAERRAQ